MNFSEALDLFFRHKSRDLAISKGAVSEKTMETYHYRLEDFARYVYVKKIDTSVSLDTESPQWEERFKQIEISSLKSDDIADYLFDCQQKGISPPTINARLYTIRSFWKLINKQVPELPDITKEVPRARYRYQRKPSVTREHMSLFISYLREESSKNKNHFRNYLLFNVIRLFGLRISEALYITLSDIHILDDAIKIEVLGKGHQRRVRVLPFLNEKGDLVEAALELKKDLKKYLRKIRPQFKAKKEAEKIVFLSQAGNRFNEDSARSAFAKAMAACQLQMYHYTALSLRHAFVSHKLAEGVPLQTVSRLVDHSNVAITSSIYAHSEEQDLREGMSRGIDLKKIH
jgi:site-specific recombinase XerD